MLRIDIPQRVQAVGWTPLPTSQLVVARVHTNAQQPAAQSAGRPVERLERTKRAEQCVLCRVSGVLGIAQGSVTHVEQLALIGDDQRVERHDAAALSRSQRLVELSRVERARFGLHSSMLLSGALRYG